MSTESTHDQNQAQLSKLIAETMKLQAETRQINQQMKWYAPVLWATGTAGLLTIAVVIARFFILELN